MAQSRTLAAGCSVLYTLPCDSGTGLYTPDSVRSKRREESKHLHSCSAPETSDNENIRKFEPLNPLNPQHFREYFSSGDDKEYIYSHRVLAQYSRQHCCLPQ